MLFAELGKATTWPEVVSQLLFVILVLGVCWMWFGRR